LYPLVPLRRSKDQDWISRSFQISEPTLFPHPSYFRNLQSSHIYLSIQSICYIDAISTTLVTSSTKNKQVFQQKLLKTKFSSPQPNQRWILRVCIQNWLLLWLYDYRK